MLRGNLYAATCAVHKSREKRASAAPCRLNILQDTNERPPPSRRPVALEIQRIIMSPRNVYPAAIARAGTNRRRLMAASTILRGKINTLAFVFSFASARPRSRKY